MQPFEQLDNYKDLMPLVTEIEAVQANLLAEQLSSMYHPKSIIDIGCGSGTYLKWFQDHGYEVLGVDAEAFGGAEIADRFMRVDLRFPFVPDKYYDLCLCIEVAEHLQAPYADTLVDSLCRCADTLCFTHAFPGQGGWFHWNEQPQSYWLEKFQRHNYVPDAEETEQVKAVLRPFVNITVQWWLVENLIILRKVSYK